MEVGGLLEAGFTEWEDGFLAEAGLGMATLAGLITTGYTLTGAGAGGLAASAGTGFFTTGAFTTLTATGDGYTFLYGALAGAAFGAGA